MDNTTLTNCFSQYGFLINVKNAKKDIVNITNTVFDSNY